MIITTLLCLYLLPAMAQETRREDKIDITYRECLMKDTSVATRANCGFEAYKSWEHEMNIAYNRLLKELKKDKNKTALKQAQAAWIAYKNAEFASYDIMLNLPGGKWQGIRQDYRIEVVRERALQLRSYLETLKAK